MEVRCNLMRHFGHLAACHCVRLQHCTGMLQYPEALKYCCIHCVADELPQCSSVRKGVRRG